MSNPYSGAPNNPPQQPINSQPGYGSPAQPAVVTTPRTSGKAIAALILGLCCFLFGIFAAVPAAIVGRSALRDIKNSGGTLGGKGMAMTGLVLGNIFAWGTVLLLVSAAVLLIVLVHQGPQIGPTFQNIQHGLGPTSTPNSTP